MTFSTIVPPIPIVIYDEKSNLEYSELNKLSTGISEQFWNGNRSAWIHRVLLNQLLPKTLYCEFLICHLRKFIQIPPSPPPPS